MSNSEEKIRQRAYEIWEQEGRPHGKDLEHWVRAFEEFGKSPKAAKTARASKSSSSAKATKAKATKAKPAKAEGTVAVATATAQEAAKRSRKPKAMTTH